MLKKVAIVLLCVGCMCLFVNKAEAGWPVLSGWTVSWGSVVCNSEWRGFGSTLKDDVQPEVGCTIYPVAVETQCMNPAGNIGGGTVFELRDREFVSYDFVTEDDLNAKGKFKYDVTFEDSYLYGVFGGGTIDNICDEFNGSGNENSLWDIAGDIDVIKMFVALRAYVDKDDDGSLLDEIPVEDVHLACQLVDEEYYCTELCDKTKRTDCIVADLYDYLTDVDGDGAPEFTFD